MGFFPLPLLLPQPGEAGGGPELPGLSFLLAGNINSLQKTLFGFFYFCPLPFNF